MGWVEAAHRIEPVADHAHPESSSGRRKRRHGLPTALADVVAQDVVDGDLLLAQAVAEPAGDPNIAVVDCDAHVVQLLGQLGQLRIAPESKL